MTLEFGDGTYYSRIWFIQGDGQDWLGALFRKPGGPWEVKYRFRYDAGRADNPDNDRRSWYGGERDRRYTEADCIETLQVLIKVVQARFGGPVHELFLGTSDFNVIRDALAREDWCHFTVEELPEPS